MELDPDGSILRGLGYETLGNLLDYPVSAHPKVDPETGNLLFHSYAVDPELIRSSGNLKVGEYDEGSGRLLSYYGVRTPDGTSSFGHDMTFTPKWFVLYDSSLKFDSAQIFNETGNVLSFSERSTFKIGLVPRRGGGDGDMKDDGDYDDSDPPPSSDDVLWFDTGKVRAVIHPLNSWEEEDGTVILWAPSSDYFSLDMNGQSEPFHMTEFRLCPRTGTVETQVIDSTYNVEFPRVRDDHMGKFARLGTAGILDQSLGGDGLFSGFTVWDMSERRLRSAVLYRDGDVGGEPAIIPKPDTAGSDEFYVGTFLYGTGDGESYFALYDGETADCVARIRLPHRVPFGFHCAWLSGEQIGRDRDHHDREKRKREEKVESKKGGTKGEGGGGSE